MVAIDDKKNTDFFLSLYQCEIFQLQRQLSNVLLIRGWSVTIFSAILGFTIYHEDRYISLAGIIPLFLMFFIEAMYDKYRIVYATKIRDIENEIFRKKISVINKKLVRNYPIINKGKNMPHTEKDALYYAMLLNTRLITYGLLIVTLFLVAIL